MGDNSQRAEIRALTGIRAFAALWVVMIHLAYALPTSLDGVRWFASLGYLGVDLFFVLSGFIISYNYWPSFVKPSALAYRRFLGLRLARLYPVHMFTLLASALLMLSVQVAGLNQRVAQAFVTHKDFTDWTGTNFIANLLMVQAWGPYHVVSWNNPSWSVSCEWFAYLIFPLLALLRPQRLPAVVSIALAGLLVSIVASVAQAGGQSPFFMLIRVSCEFMAGCLIYHAYIRYDGRAASSRMLCFGTFALLVGVLILLWNQRGIASDWAAVTFPLLILGIAVSSGAVASTLGSKPAVYWGRVSYSLYMTHGVVLWPLKALAPIRETATTLHRSALLGFHLIVIGSIAAMTYHFVEEPARKWLRRRVGRISRLPSDRAPHRTGTDCVTVDAAANQ